MQFVGLDHVVLRVTDLDRMLEFYCGALGCVVERQLPELGLTQLRAGASLIDLVPIGTPLGDKGGGVPGSGRNLDHFCLRVDAFDAKAVASWLQHQGFDVSEPGRRYGADGFGISIYVDDPEGNTVELKGEPGSD